MIAVFKNLFEQSELVIQSVSVSGQPQSCHGINETGRQTSQTAVAQRRVVFTVDDVAQGNRIVQFDLIKQVVDSQIVQIVDQRTAQQIFNGQIVYAFGILPGVSACRGIHAVNGNFAHGQSQSREQIFFGSFTYLFAQGILHQAFNFFCNHLRRYFGQFGQSVFSRLFRHFHDPHVVNLSTRLHSIVYKAR